MAREPSTLSCAPAAPGTTAAASSVLHNSEDRRILVLYVGGTIGMTKNADGALAPKAGYLTSEMARMQELRTSPEIAAFDIIEYEQLLDSSDMNAKDYLHIATDICRLYDSYDGFLVAHGTDTMHYTASALSFLLYNLAKPVIVTGAMVPLAEPFNDARRNLVISMMIASSPRICEVCIFFNDTLFRGNRCEKVYHTYGAFCSPNYPALGVMEEADFVLKTNHLLPQPTGPMMVMSDLHGNVISFHVSPDADVDTIVKLVESAGDSARATPSSPAAATAAVQKEGKEREKEVGEVFRPLDGLILVLNGVGDKADSVAASIRRILSAAEKRHVVVCATVSDITGMLTPREVQRLMKGCPGLIYLNDMCPATAEVKLMYLVGRGWPREKIAAYMPLNLRGEVTPVATPMSRL